MFSACNLSAWFSFDDDPPKKTQKNPKTPPLRMNQGWVYFVLLMMLKNTHENNLDFLRE